ALRCRFAATVLAQIAVERATANAALAQKSIVMPLNEVRLDLSHRIKHHSHDDEQTRAAKKLCGDLRHLQSLAQQTRQNRDQSEEHRARECQARHRKVEKVCRRFSRTNTGDVTADFFEIGRDL